ncbi:MULTISPECIES: glycogen debranching protein GlgX [Clostridium]|uniref:glycogen debranching protein GlgX n=1 Tax=Clostridium TaxID=1485 RepID=UPI0002D17E5A|nr:MULTISPECIES: glycogen debranching protein GlgX [Clostridium]ENZ36398.1 glycogen debranching enzyme GlgX [Clostridium butyricum 60E.3]MDB2154516.1 glycogen debranching protein GlgX [Clostridium butyricum]MDI9209322.1 glycogen debranching protein GlgX [Clostridium butyricum]MDU4587478.1 glycogen debranching protein GlgX [Clostridium sp.]MZI80398.1 glycogen debranching protein GlgX [Clostridium butyricum]
MIRVDSYPTHEKDGIKYRIGKVLPYGASIVPNGVNFSVFSKYATSCELVLFRKREKEPYAIIPFPDEFRIGDVFSMIVFDIDYENVEYGYRMDGKFSPSEGFWFNKEKYLLDPYAKSVSGRSIWCEEIDEENKFQHRGKIMYDDFDWDGDKPLETPMEELIIYETHVRSFTKHSSSGLKHGGTFAGLSEKIPYLKNLGINCIELLPIFEFDELENARTIDGKRLLNYWGYSTVNFFAPKAGYAATGKYGMEADELKNLIKKFHQAGIEVILDVVFNHTAEGNEKGPYISYRGIDNKTYYLLNPEGQYYNFSGCGNTLNCNNSIVRNYILDCLRYWVSEYHIDGFRFDLASILSRDENGAPMKNPPLLETLAHDAILSKSKLIAEAWDAGGLYQVGNFPSWGRWAEWNGKYRDTVRKFLKGDNVALEFMKRMEGSQDLYSQRTSNASINFITCHDGFTLYDLVSYNGKHNKANGENNMDGTDDNNSWNCGFEGETNDVSINELRKKQIKNAITILLMSRGIPMILCGDEFCNTQFGNNNAYCQDNEISWINWDNLKIYDDIYNYFKAMINFRKSHPVLKNSTYDMKNNKTGYPELSWHGEKPWSFNVSNDNLSLAIMYVEEKEKYKVQEDTFIYMAINMHWEMHVYELPIIPEDKKWYIFCNTSCEYGKDIFDEKIRIPIDDQKHIVVNPRSIIILLGK